MAAQDYIRLYFPGTSTAINIVSANSGTDVFVVAGDQSRLFMTGTVFLAAGTTAGADDGSYTSTGAVYSEATNQTTISVAAVPSTQGAAGTLTISNIYMEFGGPELAKWIPRWSNPAVEDEDRYGIVTSYQPVDTLKQQRFCIGGILVLEPADIDKQDTASVTWWIELYNQAVLDNALFEIFQLETIVRGGTEHTVQRCFKGYVKEMGDLLATLADDGNAARADIAFTIVADGTFTTFSNVASASYRTRPGE